MFNPLRKIFRQYARPLPLIARHIEYSAIMSADDDPSPASDDLIELALKIANRARSISVKSICERMTAPPYYQEVWPGEHYRLLAGLVAEIAPKTVVEIGK